MFNGILLKKKRVGLVHDLCTVSVRPDSLGRLLELGVVGETERKFDVSQKSGALDDVVVHGESLEFFLIVTIRPRPFTGRSSEVGRGYGLERHLETSECSVLTLKRQYIQARDYPRFEGSVLIFLLGRTCPADHRPSTFSTPSKFSESQKKTYRFNFLLVSKTPIYSFFFSHPEIFGGPEKQKKKNFGALRANIGFQKNPASRKTPNPEKKIIDST